MPFFIKLDFLGVSHICLNIGTYKHLWVISYICLKWSTIFISLINDDSKYAYLFLIHEKFQVMGVFKPFKVEVENNLNKRIKCIKFDHGDEYYGRYDDLGEQCSRPFSKVEVENNLNKRIKCINFDHGYEYYGRYDDLGEQCSRPFSKYLEKCGIVSKYSNARFMLHEWCGRKTKLDS